MVTRKPVGVPVAVSGEPHGLKTSPPYPTTPTIENGTESSAPDELYSADLTKSPAFDLIDMRDAIEQRARSNSDASSHGTWDSDDDDETEVKEEHKPEIPAPLKIRSSQDVTIKHEELPSVLRPGPSRLKSASATDVQRTDVTTNPWIESSQKSTLSSPSPQPSNNPYFHTNGAAVENSQAAWDTVASRPPMPSAAPPPLPTSPPPMPPSNAFASNNSSAFDEYRPQSWETVEKLPVPPLGRPPLLPVTNESAPERPVSRWWDTDHNETQHDLIGNPSSPTDLPPPPPAKGQLASSASSIYEPPPGPPPSHLAVSSSNTEFVASAEQRISPSIQAVQRAEGRRDSASADTPRTSLNKQRAEHYQIKLVNWYDNSCPPNSSKPAGMRQSPILIQNVNGPCPLLALVNSLVLSTPSGVDTALTDALSTREQVSLGLLLDAVFDELTSGRRGDMYTNLPDVSELYSFLLALHTGMNVNPRFITPSSTPRGSFDGKPAGIGHVHPLHRAQSKPGAFEETKEMRLYSTFNIPLIHGWTPNVDDPSYEAFMRSAPTFEDAQNIQFAEFDLNEKLRTSVLTEQEQQMLLDIQAIKLFLNTWPTQLTDHGLANIVKTLQPGQVAILFRNDHFSTVYKEPRMGILMTLVTDAGYATHDEIVWESLVDINGAACELFSGDFRVVSHNQSNPPSTEDMVGGSDEWQTVPNRSTPRPNRAAGRPASPEAPPPPLPGPRPTNRVVSAPATHSSEDSTQTEAQRRAAEQEDHDLALALQLQEEEEDRHRQDSERRQREQELSERFISNENTVDRPPIPPRRANRSSTNPVSSRPPVVRPADSDPDAPPSYEQAASDRIYHPADSGTLASGQGNPLAAYDALRRQQSATAQSIASSVSPPDYNTRQGRRRSEGNRLRRSSTLLAQPPGSYVQPGAFDGNGAPPEQRINQAAGVRDTDERCNIM